MRIFLTGATGFIGSRLAAVLIAAGHSVLGLTRSEVGAKALQEAGASPHFGALEDVDTLRAGANEAEAVVHCAFDHDFSRFVANCEKDRRAIRAMGEALRGSDRPLVITSGTGVGGSAPGKPATENVFDLHHPNPRIASEQEGAAQLEAGVKIVVVRLPQVHDTRKQGLVSPYVQISRQRGVAAYVGEGLNVWPAAHVTDVVRLYRLAVEQGRAGERFHAVDEQGVAMRDIAAVVAQGLNVPTASLTPAEAGEHFGPFGPFVGMDMPASSAWTRERLGWRPSGPSLLTDLRAMDYSVLG